MTNGTPRAVTIVDDDDAVRASLQFLLEIVAGHVTEIFASAAEFLKSDLHHFGCLILDHHMPLMTGLELVERLRDLGVAIPTLLITGSITPNIVARAAQFGVGHVLEKPPAEEVLLQFVADALR